MPDFSHEINLGRGRGKIICGVDEVGRGPLAGPVVAAAVILPHDFPADLVAQIRDSKKMSEKARENIYQPLTDHCRYALAEASVAEIDSLNILWASMLAMQRAVSALEGSLDPAQSRLRGALPIGDADRRVVAPNIDAALIDGNRAPKLGCPTVTVVKGDDKSYSIAAASIIAKVHRDRLMKKLAEAFPFYGWEHNAGYGTSQHLAALSRHGATEWHRTSFAPVRALGGG